MSKKDKKKIRIRKSVAVKLTILVWCMVLMLGGLAAEVASNIYDSRINSEYAKWSTAIADMESYSVDTQAVKALAAEVERVYGDAEKDNMVVRYSETYLNRFNHIYDMPEYSNVIKTLDNLYKSSGVESVYICVLDVDNDRCLYVIDCSDDPVEIGNFDPIAKEWHKAMDAGEVRLPVYTEVTEEYGSLRVASSPIYDENENLIAYAMVDVSIEEILAKKQDFVKNMQKWVGLFAAFVALLFMWVASFTIVGPIKKLSQATLDYSRNRTKDGELTTFPNLDISTSDEIGILYTSIKTLSKEIEDHIENLKLVTADKERIGAELDVATKIQADMLPNLFPAFPDYSEIDLYATMRPAREVGGDFYDFFMVDERHLALVIADVSGKGVPAALFMVIAKTHIKNSASRGIKPSEVLYEVNNKLCEGNDEMLFCTSWIGILDLDTGIMECSNAGHNYPAIKNPDGQFDLLKDEHGLALGAMEDVPYTDYTVELKPGSSIFVYTDGVTESINSAEEQYGEDRMLAAINKDAEAECKTLLHNVGDDIREFIGEEEAFDDITMLSFKYLGLHAGRVLSEEEMVIEATRENYETVLDFVNNCLDNSGCGEEAKIQLDISLEEIYVNIASYAYDPETGPATINVKVLDDPLKVVLTLKDHGVPYNPLEKEDPDITLSAEERDIGGLGIFMVKNLMDEVTYDYINEENILTLIKYV